MPEDVETTAIAFGLLFAMIVGACLIVATLINTARKRNRDARAQELFNLKTGLHPADDIYGGDDWPELEQFLEQRPGLRERYERDAMAHREGRRGGDAKH